MTLLKIGNWLITEDGIKWDGQDDENFFIPKEKLVELGSSSQAKMYLWPVQLALYNWITETDVYAFNTSLIYAFELYGLDFKKGSFVETFIEQQETLKNK